MMRPKHATRRAQTNETVHLENRKLRLPSGEVVLGRVSRSRADGEILDEPVEYGLVIDGRGMHEADAYEEAQRALRDTFDAPVVDVEEA